MGSQLYSTTLTLLDNASGSVDGDPALWPGGYGFFSAEGTFSGGNVQLQFQTPRGTWLAVGSAVLLSADGLGGFFLPPGLIRATSSAGSGLYAYAYPIITTTKLGS